MDIFLGGAWRSPTRMEVFLGGQWRSPIYGEIYLSGAWRRFVTFAPPLSVSASNIGGRGYDISPTVTSVPAVVSPTGGVAPYTYNWALLTESMTIDAPTRADTTFTGTVPYDSTITATARVTCTDAMGSTAAADITITLVNRERPDTGHDLA